MLPQLFLIYIYIIATFSFQIDKILDESHEYTLL